VSASPTYDGYECIRVERDGHLLLATLDHPASDLNAVDERLHHELTRLFGDLRREREARAIVLAASGRAFSAGGDFGWFPELRSVEALTELRDDARSMIWDLLEVEVPIVVALGGHAMGLGASLALLGDVIVAAEGVRIGDPHVRVGLVAGDGGAVVWPLAAGPAIAKEALLTGDGVTAERAAQLGLVNHVVPAEEVLPTARRIAGTIAANPPLAVRFTKAAVNQQIKASMLTSFETAAALELATFLSADHAEAVAAATERREPRYEGR
jgi:enoyl-CoA hydratase